MLIIPTPEEASVYDKLIEENPDLIPVLETVIKHIEGSKGRHTWFDRSVIPGHLFEKVRVLLGRKHWLIESGYNDEESYSYYAITPCACLCCQVGKS